MIENPFESGHIKNYLLAYASIVVIMILFFIASSLFNEVEDIEKKIFSTQISEDAKDLSADEEPTEQKVKFQLMDTAY